MFNKRRTYAVYIKYGNSGKVTCHINYEKDAGLAWLNVYQMIKDNKEEGKVWIIDIKRVD